MEHRRVSISNIKIPEVRITATYDEELTSQLKGSLDAVGQLAPIIVTRQEGEFILVDGLHRLQEASNRGDKDIACAIYDGDAVDNMLLNLVTNRLRGKTRASEMVQVIDHLIHVKGMTSDEVAKRTGITRDYVERLWQISEAHPAVLDALDRELIGVGVAHEISRLPRPEQQEGVMSTVAAFHMTTKQAKELVDTTLQMMADPVEPVQYEPLPPAAPPKCEVCRETPETARLTQVILCPRCYGATYQLHQQANPPAPATSENNVEAPTP